MRPAHGLFLVILFAILSGTSPSMAAHYASLRSDKVNMREGPTYAHPILWVYRRRAYPVEVVAVYDSWRRVRDVDGEVGWMSASMLSDSRTVLITAKPRAALHAYADPRSRILAYAATGVVARLKACEVSACRISAGGVDGWIDKRQIWGVDAGEVFE
ncbi:MAG: aspartyl-trna synthetase [Alphaproteobacteria bacterium]|nr:aspartyl-trna synthetase [Alphaproteobacteria bacterium]